MFPIYTVRKQLLFFLFNLNIPHQEPKEEEMTEEEKAAQKAKPVATTPIPGTPWYVAFVLKSTD